MLISMEPKRLYDIVASHAKSTGKYVLVVNYENIFFHTEEQKASLKEFYSDAIPEEEIDEIFGSQYNFYEFNAQSSAVETATDWFPRTIDLDDMTYFVECYVITPSGGIPHTNKVTARPLTESEE